jgi:DNA-directed RNA polymerase subunit E'/Rpb7
MALSMSTVKSNKAMETRNLFYHNCVITTRVRVPFQLVGNNIKEVLESMLRDEIEGKCIKEGYVKSGSVKVITYSAGECIGTDIEYKVAHSCMVCCPVEGMTIKVVVTNVTKAGIRARSRENVSPIDVFVARDHNVMKKNYNEIEVGDHIMVEIVGHRFELNDKTISVIADLSGKVEASRPRLVMKKKTEQDNDNDDDNDDKDLNNKDTDVKNDDGGDNDNGDDAEDDKTDSDADNVIDSDDMNDIDSKEEKVNNIQSEKVNNQQPEKEKRVISFNSKGKDYWKLSNFYGGVEANYMKDRFLDDEVKDLFDKFEDSNKEQFISYLKELQPEKKWNDAKLAYWIRMDDGDPIPIRGILSKLVGTAVKATPSGRKRLKIVKKMANMGVRELKIKPNTTDDEKKELMLSLLRKKFANPEYAEVLLSTKDAILHERPLRGKGDNWTYPGGDWLGQLLMKVRKEIE